LLDAPPSKVMAIDGPLSVTRWRIGGAPGGVVGRGRGVISGAGEGVAVEVRMAAA
jgi:hypothetical protein